MIINETIELQTKGHGDTIDITPQVEERLAQSRLKNGTVTLFITGSTAGITTIEFEPRWSRIFRSCGRSWRRRVCPITMTRPGVMPTATPMCEHQCWGLRWLFHSRMAS